jgi:hypothetical protein
LSRIKHNRIGDALLEAARIIGFIGFGFSFGAITWNINRDFAFAFPIICIEIIVLLGLIFSWRQKLFISSVLLLLSSIGQGIRTFYTHQLLGWIADILLFLVASILFFILWWLTRQKSISKEFSIDEFQTGGKERRLDSTINRTKDWMGKAGRIFGFIGFSLSARSVAFFIINGLTFFDPIFISLISATFFSLSGLILSWRRMALASPLLFLSLICLIICAYYSRQISELWTWISFLLFLIPGILFICSWKLFKEATTSGMAMTK